MKVEAGVVLPPQEALIDVEEGQLTAISRLAKEARHEPPSAEVLAGAVDLRKTRLSAWRFDGYLPNPASLRPRCDAAGNCSTTSRHKVTRVFSKDDSTVLFEDWNMAADGAALVATPPQTVAIGRFFGNAGALRSPSGCASASLSWHGEGKSFSLTIFGPLSLQQQREVLLDLARSIEMAAPKHGLVDNTRVISRPAP